MNKSNTFLGDEEEFIIIDGDFKDRMMFINKENIIDYNISNAIRFGSVENAKEYIKEKNLPESVFIAEFEEASKLNDEINLKRHQQKMDELSLFANTATYEDRQQILSQLDSLLYESNDTYNQKGEHNTMEIPQEIKCPYCKGEGQYFEGDDISQCEYCLGEGCINVKDYAEAHHLSLEEAISMLRADSDKEE